MMKKYRQRLTKPSIYATKASWEYLKFFIGSLIAALITYLLISLIPSNILNAKFLNTAIALVLGSGISFLAFSLFYYGENRKAFMYLHKTKTRGRDIFNKNQKEIFTFIKTEYNSLLYDIVRIPNEQIKSTYTNQIKIASIFSTLAKESFYATSYDLPSQFYNKNKDYFNTMDSSTEEIVGVVGGIPNKTRIFVCSLDEFIEDIYQNPRSFIFLIKWHLEWHKKTGTEKTNSPIMFYLYKNEADTDTLDNYFNKLKNENKIPDFMIVDNKLVYGRIEKNIIRDNQVSLKAIATKEFSNIFGKYSGKPDEKTEEIIKIYKGIFTNIYENSIEPEEIEKLLFNKIEGYKSAMEKIDADLRYDESKKYSSQIYKFSEIDLERRKKLLKTEIQSIINNYNTTQDRDNHYSNVFKNNKNGIKFTQKWIELMNEGQNECIALDTADSRNGKTRFLDKWAEDELYKEFLLSSAKAIKDNGAKFKRVFILDEKLNDRLRFHNFLQECVINYGLEIGVVLLSDLYVKNIVTEEKVLLMSDFVMLNIKNKNLKNKNIFGFKISKSDDFKPNSLSFYNNLIIPAEFKKFYTYFEQIYSNSTKFDNQEDVNSESKIDRFINLKNNNI